MFELVTGEWLECHPAPAFAWILYFISVLFRDVLHNVTNCYICDGIQIYFHAKMIMDVWASYEQKKVRAKNKSLNIYDYVEFIMFCVSIRLDVKSMSKKVRKNYVHENVKETC